MKMTHEEEIKDLMKDLEASVKDLQDIDEIVYDTKDACLSVEPGRYTLSPYEEGIVAAVSSGDSLLRVSDSLIQDVYALKSDSLLRKDKYKLKFAEYFMMKYQESLEEVLKEKLSWNKDEIEDFIEGRKQFDVDEIIEIENQFEIKIYEILKG